MRSGVMGRFGPGGLLERCFRSVVLFVGSGSESSSESMTSSM